MGHAANWNLKPCQNSSYNVKGSEISFCTHTPIFPLKQNPTFYSVHCRIANASLHSQERLIISGLVVAEFHDQDIL